VTLHYFKTFFLPTELTADSDLGVINPLGTEALAGYVFVLVLAWMAVRASRARSSRPVAFGIVWFFVALLPTSLIPLGEVTNDHRMIFPFAGLALAVFWQLRLVLFRRTERLTAGRTWQRAAVAGIVIVLLAAAAGTRQRNRVWRTDESLWRDVTLKSPRNGRGLMNYGLTFMKRGDYATALDYFQRAMPYTPNYWTLEVNLGVATGALGRAAEAEAHFQRAIALAPQRPEPDVFYARWLRDIGRPRECALQLETALRKNPHFFEARDLLLEVRASEGDRPAAERLARETLTLFPGDQTARRILDPNAVPPRQAAAEPSSGLATPEALLQLSHRLYGERKYQECILAARQALALKPDYADAFNNLAAAYNALGMWDDGIHAAMEAVRLSPDNQLARNNLLWGMAQKQRAAAAK
jgi:tetratricopeptide (TPR) repeat protein